MSDTPETDDQSTINAVNDNGYQIPCVDIEFARKLERERDEAREALKHIEEYGTEEINAAVELRQKLASALVERDEAREKAERYRLEANAIMMQRDEAMEEINRYREKLDILPIYWDV